MQTRVKRPIVMTISILLCGTVLVLGICSIWIWRDHCKFSEASDAARVFVYDHMAECGQAFADYVATEDSRYLEQAQQAATKTASACYAWGESYPYRADDDTADDAIQEWGIQFLIKTAEYLEGLDKNDVSEEDQGVLDTLAEIFQPDETGRITFMSIFWNTSHSNLNDSPLCPYLTFDDGVLQRPEL